MYYRPYHCYGSYSSLDNGELNKAYRKITKKVVYCVFVSICSYSQPFEDKALVVCCYQYYTPWCIYRYIDVRLNGHYSVVMLRNKNHTVMTTFKYNYNSFS